MLVQQHEVVFRKGQAFVDGVLVMGPEGIDEEAFERLSGKQISPSARVQIISAWKLAFGVSPNAVPAGKGTYRGKSRITMH